MLQVCTHSSLDQTKLALDNLKLPFHYCINPLENPEELKSSAGHIKNWKKMHSKRSGIQMNNFQIIVNSICQFTEVRNTKKAYRLEVGCCSVRITYKELEMLPFQFLFLLEMNGFASKSFSLLESIPSGKINTSFTTNTI